MVVGDPVCFQESSPICFTNDVMKSNRGVSWQGVHLLNLSASDTREAFIVNKIWSVAISAHALSCANR